MTIRTNNETVQCILPPNKISDVTPFIRPASLLTDRLAASSCGSTLIDAELKEIETWLTAHFAAVGNPGLALISEDFEAAKNVYSRGTSKNKGGLLSTQFGQMANTLSNGCLAEVDKRKISLSSLGGEHYTDLAL